MSVHLAVQPGAFDIAAALAAAVLIALPSPAGAQTGSPSQNYLTLEQKRNEQILYPYRDTQQCYMVDNPKGTSLFVPYKTVGEWEKFKAAAPGLGRTVAKCCPATTVNLCGNTYNLPSTRDGKSHSITTNVVLDTNRTYRAQCTNYAYASQTITGIKPSTTASGVLYAPPVSIPGNIWIMRFAARTPTATTSFSYQCNGHSWQVATSGSCTQLLPASYMEFVEGYNCWTDNNTATSSPTSSFCQSHVGGAPAAWKYDTWGNPMTYAYGKNRPLRGCENFQAE